MRDDHPPSQSVTTGPSGPDEIPRALRMAGLAGMILETVLGLAGLALAVWFQARRPTIAVLVLALLLIAYALFHAWQRYEEHPDRGRRVRRPRGTRTES